MKAAVATRTVEMIPLSIRADVVANSAKDEERTVDLVFSTGAAVERYDWRTGERYLEKLSMDPKHVRLDRLNTGGPLLDAHSAWSVHDQLGAVVEGSAVIKGKKGHATVQFSRRPEVEPIRQDVRDGIIRNVSIAYRAYEYEETKPAKQGSLAVRTAIDWEPFEISMVPIPADAGARTRSEDKSQTYSCVIHTRGQEDSMDEQEQDATRTGGDPKPKPATPPTPPAPAQSADEVRAEAVKAERERASAIRLICRKAKLDDPFAQGLVDKGVTLDQARAAVLDKLAGEQEKTPTEQHVRVEVGEEKAEKWQRGVIAGLLHRAGVTDLIRAAQKAKPDHPAFKGLDLEPGEFRGLSLLDLGREALERAGQKTRGLGSMELAGLVLRGGMNTTSDFAVALENVLHKTLLAAYMVTPDTWRRFCAVGSVTDFRPHPRYRSSFLSQLDTLNEHGEFKNKSLPDASKESITAATKGNIIALSRQAIVNDDMSIFSRVAAQVGRAAALSIEVDVYATLALNGGLGPTMNDTKTLFHADHANIGTGSALAVAGLDADRVTLASQKDPSSNEILDLRPAVLVIAVGLGGEARVLNQAQYEPIDNKFQKPNKVVGLFRDIVDTPRLSGTRRYLFVEPAQMPVLEVAFLEGQQEPFLEQREGWRIDGTEWKVRLDYGVAAVEFRGAVTNAGV